MFEARRSVKVIGLVLLAGALAMMISGCRGIFGRNSGPIDAFAFLPQFNEQLSEPVQGAINNRPDPKEIMLVVPPGTDMSRLVATVTLNTEATITVISSGRRVVQDSTTPNNFLTPVTYAIEIPGEDEPIMYTVRVREASTNARLIDLSIAGSTYQRPTFGPTVDSYEAEVPYATSTIQVTARAEDPNANAISINGTKVGGGQGTGQVDFSTGDSVDITVEVLAEDRATRMEYSVTVVRGEPDRNSNLMSLSSQTAPLDQTFTVNRKSYTAQIPYSANQVEMTARPESEFSSVRINDIQTDANGTATVPLESAQKQTLDIVVTAQDGSTSVYTVSLTRAAPDTNVSLSDITTSAGQLTPSFAPEETFYSLNLPQDQASVTIAAQTQSRFTTLELTADTAATQGGGGRPGQITVDVGEGQQTQVIITATAESGTTRDYRITVRREIGMGMLVLSELTLKGAELTPAFNPEVTTYEASVDADVDFVRLTAVPKAPAIEITVGDAVYADSPIVVDLLLYEGVTVKTPITLTSPNGLQRVYTIAVTRAEAPSRIGRRILQVTMDELRLPRMIASSLNSNRADLEPQAQIQVRYHDTGELVYEDVARVVTEKSRQDVLVSMSYQSQFIDMDLGKYLDIDVSIPTTAGRYLNYDTVVYADGSLDLRPEVMVLADSRRMEWPQPGTPRPVTASVRYQTSIEAQRRLETLGDGFVLGNQGNYEITIELINLGTGKSLGTEVLMAKPGSVHGRSIDFANGIELPEGARIGYVLSTTTQDGRMLRDHGVAQVRTTKTFENGEWEYATLYVDATLELVDEAGM